VRIFEISRGDPDPFAARRGDGRRAPGRYRVALWSAGASRVAVMKVVRELLGCGLDTARAHLGELPKELLVGVAQSVAEDAVRRLREVGADAEAFEPELDSSGQRSS
jgi:large subunit ribosomal protein L7/L12